MMVLLSFATVTVLHIPRTSAHHGHCHTFSSFSNTFGRPLAHRIEVLFEEDRVIELNGTSFTDDFEPFDVHVYRLVPGQQ
jgi:hypothetical protein